MSLLKYLPSNQNVAVVTKDESLTYFELHQRIQEKIQSLNNLHKNDLVWLDCRNNLETLTSYFACWEKKCSVLPIDPKLTSVEIESLVKIVPPQHILLTTGTSLLTAVQPVASKASQLKDIRLIQMSSGSTGAPKLILIDEKALLARSKDIRSELALHDQDRTLCTVPLSHSHGIDCLALPTLWAGGTLYLFESETAFPYRILNWIEKYQITFFSSLPQMYDLFNQLGKSNKYDLKSLRYPFCGSAALSEQTAIEFNHLFGLNIRQGYGLAEIGVICLNKQSQKENYQSVGKPMSNIDWKLGPEGELLVKSDSLFKGYFDNITETEKRLVDGYLKTEDLVSVDENGFFYILGRQNDFINVLGKKVYPREIESVLTDFPDLKEYCVTGQTDPQRGEIPVLHAIKHNPDQNDDDLRKKFFDFLQDKMEEYKIPRKIIFHDSFPKSPLGKILKSKLNV